MSLLKAIKAQLGLSSTPANNFTITAEADNGTLKLARGNAGATTQDILTVDANGVAAAVNGMHGNLFSGTVQNSTSGTSINFTDIPSWVKRITVILNSVSTNGSALLRVQLGSGSIDSSGYVGSTTSLTSGTGSLALSNGFDIYINNATAVTHGTITLNLIAGNSWICSGVLGQSNIAGTLVVGGAKTLSGTLDRIRITTMNGTDIFDSGSINILYEG